MFNPVTSGEDETKFVKLTAPETIGGGLAAVMAALADHETSPRLILDVSKLKTIEPGCGIALVRFMQQRGFREGFRTCLFGLDPAVRKTNFVEFFMFVEPKELATTEDEAIAKVCA